MGEFDPVAIVTTLQPVLVLWLLAISFFVTLAVVAVISKGRQWYELACIFLLGFVLFFGVGLGIATWVLDIAAVQIEVISLNSG